MSKNMLKRWTSLVLSLTLVFAYVGMLISDGQYAKSAETDPFETMVDESVELVDMTSGNPEDAVAEADVERMQQSGKTSRFIIKYKENRTNAIAQSRAGSALSSTPYQLEPMEAHTDLSVLSLEEEVYPSELAQTLKDAGVEQDIEFIQPDYSMSLSDAATEEEGGAAGEEAVPGETQTNIEEPEQEREELSQVPSEEESQAGEEAPESPSEENGENENLETGPKPGTEQDSEDQETDDGVEDIVEENEEQPEQAPEIEPIIVALIDTAIDLTHTAYADILLENPDEIPGDGLDNDNNGIVDDVFGANLLSRDGNLYDAACPINALHATHLAGVIAAAANQANIPVRILPIQVFENGVGYTSDIIEAIAYAESRGATVINLSFGSKYQNPALEQAIAASSALFVCAAGNARSNLSETPVYPASYRMDNVISATAVNADGGLCYFSNYGADFVDIAADGRDVVSSVPEGGSGAMSGTSVSAAYVSACAAVARSQTESAAAARERVLACAQGLSNLLGKVAQGKRASIDNIAGGVMTNQIQTNTPADDFSVDTYAPLSEDQSFALFSSKKTVKVVAGQKHALALLDDGSVWAWGNNDSGQLGNGTTVASAFPVQVIGLGRITDVEVGGRHSLAVDEDGNLWAWGNNQFGQLGIGSQTNSSIPIKVDAFGSEYPSAFKIAAGENFTAVVTEWSPSDCVLCTFGDNQYGQLGLGSSFTGTMYTSPQQSHSMIRDEDPIILDAGYAHGVLLHNDGELEVWGLNSRGQLGDGTTANCVYPKRMRTDATYVAAGPYWTVYAVGNNIYGHGDNQQGQIPTANDSVSGIQRTPVLLFSSSAVEQISLGEGHGLIRKQDGSVYGWGSNANGCIQPEATESAFTALTQAEGVADAVSVSGGDANSFYVLNDGSAWSCGSNAYNLRAFGVTQTSVPVRVQNLQNVTEVKAGEKSAIAITQGGVVYSWGTNQNQLLGISGLSYSFSPVALQGLPLVVDIAYGTDIAYAVGQDRIDYNTGSLISDIYRWGGSIAEPTQFDSGYYLQIKDIETTRSSHLVCLMQNGQTRTSGCSDPDPCENDSSTNVSAFAISIKHGILVKNDSTVWTWGDNTYGQLGNGTTAVSSEVVQVTSLSSVKAVECGSNNSFAIKQDGTLWAWGQNQYGSLGIGSTTSKSTPVQVTGISGVEAVSAGNGFTLALKTDGTVWGWGRNSTGQLGKDSVSNYTSPIQIQGLQNIVAIEAGSDASYAVRSDGAVFALGSFLYGQLGDGRGFHADGLQRLAVTTTMDEAGLEYQLGTIRDNDAQYCGDLKSASQEDLFKFTVADTARITTVSVYGNQMQLTLMDGARKELYSRGAQERAYLEACLEPGTYYLKVTGRKPGAYRLYIGQMNFYGNLKEIEAGENHSLALENNGNVWSWGSNTYGELGDTRTDGSAPAQIQGISNAISIAAGDGFSLAVKEDGTVWSWGKPLGTAATVRPAPEQIPGLTNAVSVKAGAGFAAVLKSDGTVWCWGDNSSGQLGNGSTDSSGTPAQVSGLMDVTEIAAGEQHAIALKSDGTVWGWGRGRTGQLDKYDKYPKQVERLQSIQRIAAGGNISFAITKNKQLYSWGNNSKRQIGLTPESYIYPPEVINGIENVDAVAVGKEHTMVVCGSKIYTVGSSSNGRLGRTGNYDNFLPISLADNGRSFCSISAGGSHSLAVRSDGSVFTWGNNSDGQAVGSAASYTTPTEITSSFYHSAVNTPERLSVNREYSTVLGKGSTVYYGNFNVQYGGLYQIAPTGDAGVVSAQVFDSAEVEILPQQEHLYTLQPGTYQLRLTAAEAAETARFAIVPGELANTEIPGVRVFSAGERHSLLVDGDGYVWAWGTNTYGQLGDDTTEGRSYPIRVPNLTNVIDVAAGYDHSVAITDAGDVYCWGNNTDGQLGNGAAQVSKVPVKIMEAADAAHVYAGNASTYLLTDSGNLYAWGDNQYGQLGVGSTADKNVPTLVSGISLQALAAGDGFALGLKEDGSAYAWGNNTDGQLGINALQTNKSSPQKITALSDVIQISAGESHAAAVSRDGSVYVWGCNDSGELGLGEASAPKAAPQHLETLVNAENAYAGSGYTLIKLRDGTLTGFGKNQVGQLGIGDTTARTEPAALDALTDIAAVSAGAEHALAAKWDGTLLAWGNNDVGQLGNGGLPQQELPDEIPGLSNVIGIAVGTNHALAVKEDGTVWTWGKNIASADANSTVDTPAQVSSLYQVKKAAGGNAHSIVLKTDGTVWAWGDNTSGQLGNGTNTRSNTPIQVPNLANVIDVVAGYEHNVAVKEDGTVWTWGGNSYGQLGLGDTTNRNTPQQVPGLSGIDLIATGGWHNLAADQDDTIVYAWGRNTYHEVGGNSLYQTSPISHSLSATIVALAAGSNHSLAEVNTTWDVFGWGCALNGRLGSNIEGTVETPTCIGSHMEHNFAGGSYSAYKFLADPYVEIWGYEMNQDILPKINQLTMNENFFVALTDTGHVWTWGTNDQQRLGRSIYSYRQVPINITMAVYVNDSEYKAIDIGANTNYTGVLNRRAEKHYYRFSVAQTGDYELRLDGGQIAVFIYEPVMILNEGPFSPLDHLSTIVALQANQTYYLEISSVNVGNFHYSLQPAVESSHSQEIPVKPGVDYDFTFRSSVSSFENITYTLKYSTADFEIATLCADAEQPVTAVGAVAGTDVEILQVGNGEIQFKINKNLTEPWNGPVNTIRLRGLRKIQSKVQLLAG